MRFCLFSISKSVIFHLQRRNSSELELKRKPYDIWFREKIYIDMGYKSATQQTDKWRKDTKGKEATLI